MCHAHLRPDYSCHSEEETLDETEQITHFFVNNVSISF